MKNATCEMKALPPPPLLNPTPLVGIWGSTMKEEGVSSHKRTVLEESLSAAREQGKMRQGTQAALF